jgi:hypothetical protein
MRQSELLKILDEALQERDESAVNSACAMLALLNLSTELKALRKDYRVLSNTHRLVVKDRAAVCEQLDAAQRDVRTLKAERRLLLQSIDDEHDAYTVGDHMRAVHERVFTTRYK